MYGKAIELYLENGTADGLVTAELYNWNGKAIKIPRTEVSDCNRDDIKGVGVYFLICKEKDGADSVYIGEAEDVHKRLLDHLYGYEKGSEEYYWVTAVVFIGQSLNKALIRYLEYRLVEITKECGRSRCLTKNTFKNTVITEAQKASMEEFIDNVRILMNTLGYKILERVPQATDETVYLFCKNKSGALAKGFVSAGGFTVLKGSIISNKIVNSFKQFTNYYNLRISLIEDGTIKDNVFTKDYEFSAPSAASCVVLGAPSNGRDEWKTEENKKLKEL